jgi:hypothetical protein
MIFNFFTARWAAAREIDAIDFSRDEVLHPVIADLVSAQEKASLLSPFERDYGSKRRIDRMPVAFV